LKLDQDMTWKSVGMYPGTGGEELMQKWLGWTKGRQYALVKGAVVQLNNAKL